MRHMTTGRRSRRSQDGPATPYRRAGPQQTDSSKTQRMHSKEVHEMRHTTIRPSLPAPEAAVRAAVSVLAALALVAGGAGAEPGQAHALDDEYGSSAGEQYETCMAAIPGCGVHWPSPRTR